MEISALNLKVRVVSIISNPSRWMFGKAAIISLELIISAPKRAQSIISKSLKRLLFLLFFTGLFCVFKLVCSILFYFCGVHSLICIGVVYKKAPIGLVNVIIGGNAVYLGVQTIGSFYKIML